MRIDQLAGTAAWFAPCADLVEDLNAEQRARVLAVTHSSYLEGMPPTREVVARMAEIEQGTMSADGAVAELFARYGMSVG